MVVNKFPNREVYQKIKDKNLLGADDVNVLEEYPGLEWKGEYSETVTYYKGAIVFYENGLYVMVTTGATGAIPGFDNDWELFGKYGVTEDDVKNALSYTPADSTKYLPLTGGTLTGNLTGKYITGNWLQATDAGHLSESPTKIPVFDSKGWIYYRTPAELLTDIGGSSGYTLTENDKVEIAQKVTEDGTEFTLSDFPTALKNPKALTFTGAATGTYDGSAALTISKVNAYRAAMSYGTPETLTGGTHTVTLNLTHVSSSNAATTVEDQGSYTATLTADADYTIQTVTINMGEADISSCYADGVISIPNVTGDVVITAVATATVYADIELYSPNGVTLNKKYSGTSIVDGNGYYLTAVVPINMAKYRYIKVNGAHMSGYGGATTAADPTLYKIAFLKSGVIGAVKYTDNIALQTDATMKQWTMDMSKYAQYQQYDAVQLSVLISTAAITSGDVLDTSVLQVTCSTTLEE